MTCSRRGSKGVDPAATYGPLNKIATQIIQPYRTLSRPLKYSIHT